MNIVIKWLSWNSHVNQNNNLLLIGQKIKYLNVMQTFAQVFGLT
jgi:hypothetical protein